MEEIRNVTITAPEVFNFKNEKLNVISAEIAKIGKTMTKGNHEIAKLLGEVKRDKLYEEDEFKSVAEYAKATFNIDRALAYQLAKVGERFYLVDSETAKKAAAMLPPSNLAELVNMTDEQIEKAIESGEITETTGQKKLRDVAAGVKHSKPKVLEDYEIDVEIVHIGVVDRIHFDALPLEAAMTEVRASISLSSTLAEKPFVREGKYEGKYHKGVKIVLCEEGEIVKIVYGIVNKTPAKKSAKKSLDDMTDEEIMEMLAARKAAREAEAAKK